MTKKNCLTLEDDTNSRSRNVSSQPPINAA